MLLCFDTHKSGCGPKSHEEGLEKSCDGGEKRRWLKKCFDVDGEKLVAILSIDKGATFLLCWECRRIRTAEVSGSGVETPHQIKDVISPDVLGNSSPLKGS